MLQAKSRLTCRAGKRKGVFPFNPHLEPFSTRDSPRTRVSRLRLVPAICRKSGGAGPGAAGGGAGRRGRSGGAGRGLWYLLVGAARPLSAGGGSDWSGLGPRWRRTRPPTPLSSCRSVTGAAVALPRSPGTRVGARGSRSCDRRAGGEEGKGCLWVLRGGASGAAAWREARMGPAGCEGRAAASRQAGVCLGRPGGVVGVEGLCCVPRVPLWGEGRGFGRCVRRYRPTGQKW